MSSVTGRCALVPYTAIEEVKTNVRTPVFTAAFSRLTLPITLFV